MSSNFELVLPEEDFHDEVDSQTLGDVALLVFLKSLSCTVCAPFDNTKILLQVQNRTQSGVQIQPSSDQLRGAEQVVENTDSQYGLLKLLKSNFLFRGNITKIIEETARTLLTKSISEAMYTPELYEEEVSYGGQNITLLVPDEDALAPGAMISTGIAGLLTGALLTPLEVVHTRMVLQRKINGKAKYENTLQALALIYDEEGLEGLFAGWQVSAFAHGLLPLLESIEDALMYELFGGAFGDPGVSSFTYAICDFIYQVLVVQLQMPFEVMRRRLHVQGAVEHGYQPITRITRTKYSGVKDTVTRIFAEEGPTTFYHGFLSHFLATTGAVIVYYAMEIVSQ
eukprot:CFRG1854T1